MVGEEVGERAWSCSDPLGLLMCMTHLATGNRFRIPICPCMYSYNLGHSSQMTDEIDTIDRRILAELQRDGTLSVDQLSERVSLSRNACWRRVKRLEEERRHHRPRGPGRCREAGPRAVGLHPDPHVEP